MLFVVQNHSQIFKKVPHFLWLLAANALCQVVLEHPVEIWQGVTRWLGVSRAKVLFPSGLLKVSPKQMDPILRALRLNLVMVEHPLNFYSVISLQDLYILAMLGRV